MPKFSIVRRSSCKSEIRLLACLIVLTSIALGLYYQPIIYFDDWAFLFGLVRGTLRFVNLAERRPLGFAWLVMLYKSSGLNIWAYVAVLGILNIVAALQLYKLLRRLLPGSRYVGVAAAAALIFLIYPADYTRSWLTMVNVKMVVCFTLLYADWLLTYVYGGRLLALVAADGLLVLTLFVYEAQLGVALAWPLILMVIRPFVSRQRKLALVTPLVLGAAFAVWRTRGFAAAGIQDNYLATANFGVAELIRRIWLGMKVLAWSWQVIPGKVWNTGHVAGIAFVVGAVCAALGIGILIGPKQWRAVPQIGKSAAPSHNDLPHAKQLLALLVGGCILAMAGFVPAILVVDPNLAGVASRTNIFALPGAAVAIAAALGLAARLLRCNQARFGQAVVVATVPLLVLGIITQLWVQSDAGRAWREQVDIWRQLFHIAPSLKPDTAVYFWLPGYQDRAGYMNWQRTPLTASWEVASALRLLYNQDSLSGDAIFPDQDLHDEPTVTSAGFQDHLDGKITGYDRALVLAYDGHPRRLRVVEDLQKELGLNWPVTTYRPYDRILADRAAGVQFRHLVATSVPLALFSYAGPQK